MRGAYFFDDVDLSDEQLAAVNEIKQKYIEAQTVQHTIEQVSESLTELWQRAGYARPAILMGRSPIEACAMATAVRIFDVVQDPEKFKEVLLRRLSGAASDSSGTQSTQDININDMSAEIDNSYAVGLLSIGRTDDYSGDELQEKAERAVQTYLYDIVGDSPSVAQSTAYLDLVRSYSVELVQHAWYLSAWWLLVESNREVADYLGIELDMSAYTDYAKLSEHCAFSVAYDKLAVASSFPVEINWTGGMLHCDTGPAVRFADGYSLWYLFGIKVDPRLVCHPLSFSPEELIESGRSLTDKFWDYYGWDTLLYRCNYRVIDQCVCDDNSTHKLLVELRPGTTALISINLDSGEFSGDAVRSGVTSLEDVE